MSRLLLLVNYQEFLQQNLYEWEGAFEYAPYAQITSRSYSEPEPRVSTPRGSRGG
jgi:hypothetical protein